jgi:hypothetical protein
MNRFEKIVHYTLVSLRRSTRPVSRRGEHTMGFEVMSCPPKVGCAWVFVAGDERPIERGVDPSPYRACVAISATWVTRSAPPTTVAPRSTVLPNTPRNSTVQFLQIVADAVFRISRLMQSEIHEGLNSGLRCWTRKGDHAGIPTSSYLDIRR